MHRPVEIHDRQLTAGVEPRVLGTRRRPGVLHVVGRESTPSRPASRRHHSLRRASVANSHRSCRSRASATTRWIGGRRRLGCRDRDGRRGCRRLGARNARHVGRASQRLPRDAGAPARVVGGDGRVDREAEGPRLRGLAIGPGVVRERDLPERGGPALAFAADVPQPIALGTPRECLDALGIQGPRGRQVRGDHDETDVGVRIHGRIVLSGGGVRLAEGDPVAVGRPGGLIRDGLRIVQLHDPGPVRVCREDVRIAHHSPRHP